MQSLLLHPPIFLFSRYDSVSSNTVTFLPKPGGKSQIPPYNTSITQRLLLPRFLLLQPQLPHLQMQLPQLSLHAPR